MREDLRDIIAAHGGAEHWRSLEAIEAEISVRGFLFTAKRIPVLNHVRVRALTRAPRLTFFDFPQKGQNSELVGVDEVCISNPDGEAQARRINPRAAFRGLRRLFYWDSLDFAYFGGYATWNYLMTPFLFLQSDFVFEDMEPLNRASRSWTRLSVTFPDSIPTHCKVQVFYFDDQWFLRRLDYTAEVVGRWARAAHLCDQYKDFAGLKIATRRRVFPLIVGSRPAHGPMLVAIDVHNVWPIGNSTGHGAR